MGLLAEVSLLPVGLAVGLCKHPQVGWMVQEKNKAAVEILTRQSRQPLLCGSVTHSKSLRPAPSGGENSSVFHEM